MARMEERENTETNSSAARDLINQNPVKADTTEMDIRLKNKSDNPKTPEDDDSKTPEDVQKEKNIDGDKKQEFKFWALPLTKKIDLIKETATVEPMMFMYILSTVISSIAIHNLYLEKACRVNMAYGDEVCDAIARRETQNYTQQELVVQQLSSKMNALKSMANNSVPVLFALFAGSWSDRHRRRKHLILQPVVGEIFNSLALLINWYFFYELPMEVAAWTEAFFLAMSGGWITSFVALYSYITDVTSEETRTTRMGIVNLCTNIGIPLGTAISGISYQKLGFYGVMSISTALLVCSLWFGHTMIHETPKPKSVANPHNKSFLKDFFDTANVKDTLKSAFKRREGNQRFKIIIVMITLILSSIPWTGEYAVLYLFIRLRLHWDDVTYSMWATFTVIINIIGTAFIVGVLSQALKLHDAIIGIVACISKIVSNIIYAFVSASWMMYVGGVADMLVGGSSIGIRSIISKIVPSNEIGQINSFFGVCTSIVPLIVVPVYTIIYQHTAETFPGAFWLIGIFFKLLVMTIFGYIYTDRVKELDGLETELLCLADRFQLEGLKALCQNALFSQLTASNSVQIFLLADKFNAKQLREAALSSICAHMHVACKTREWQEIVESSPELTSEIVCKIYE